MIDLSFLPIVAVALAVAVEIHWRSGLLRSTSLVSLFVPAVAVVVVSMLPKSSPTLCVSVAFVCLLFCTYPAQAENHARIRGLQLSAWFFASALVVAWIPSAQAVVMLAAILLFRKKLVHLSAERRALSSERVFQLEYQRSLHARLHSQQLKAAEQSAKAGGDLALRSESVVA